MSHLRRCASRPVRAPLWLSLGLAGTETQVSARAGSILQVSNSPCHRTAVQSASRYCLSFRRSIGVMGHRCPHTPNQWSIVMTAFAETGASVRGSSALAEISALRRATSPDAIACRLWATSIVPSSCRSAWTTTCPHWPTSSEYGTFISVSFSLLLALSPTGTSMSRRPSRKSRFSRSLESARAELTAVSSDVPFVLDEVGDELDGVGGGSVVAGLLVAGAAPIVDSLGGIAEGAAAVGSLATDDVAAEPNHPDIPIATTTPIPFRLKSEPPLPMVLTVRLI